MLNPQFNFKQNCSKNLYFSHFLTFGCRSHSSSKWKYVDWRFSFCFLFVCRFLITNHHQQLPQGLVQNSIGVSPVALKTTTPIVNLFGHCVEASSKWSLVHLLKRRGNCRPTISLRSRQGHQCLFCLFFSLCS